MVHQLFIVPGGNYVTIGDNLSPETANRIHNAVHRGVKGASVNPSAI